MRALILAGGNGKRLWPLSSDSLPKQFLHVGQKGSLLEQTIQRFRDFEILVIGSQKHATLLRECLGPSLGDAILVEPVGRSTAPAITLGIKYLVEKCLVSLEEVCVVSPSDLYFETEEDFLRLLPSAEQGAKEGNIVTFGIEPTYPETGYGYIKAKEGKGLRPIDRFIEKPELETAQRLLAEGNYYWNAGIFVFQIKHFLNELQCHAPSLFEWFQQPYDQALQSFNTLEAISIDHALMEKTRNSLLISYPSFWSDLGTWKRLEEALPKDHQGNVLSGEIEAIDTKGTLIFGDDIVTLGVKDLIIVKRGGKTVICSKKEMERLSSLQDLLETKTY